jgi:thiol-disulfide isomerase/thioredoxin
MYKRILIAFLIFLGLSSVSFAADSSVTLDFYYGEGCPHCTKAKPFLDTLEEKYPDLTVNRYEVWYSEANSTMLTEAASRIGVEVGGVPAFFIGDDYLVGYGEDDTTGAELEALVVKHIGDVKPPLSDLQESQYSDAITYLINNKVVKGYADNTFKPKNHINRAEFLKILMAAKYGDNAIGSYCFSDVTVEWFAPFVCFAKGQGIVKGYSDGTFKPANNINHAEALKMLAETFDVEINENTDGEWYQKYVDAADTNDYLLNDVGSLVTREEMSEMVFRIME